MLFSENEDIFIGCQEVVVESQNICEYQILDDDIKIEYEIDAANSGFSKYKDWDEYDSNESLHIDSEIENIQNKINDYNHEIDGLTNHSDKLDYVMAVASGILSGMIDSFFVKEFSFDDGSKWGAETVNNFVIKVAQSQGFKGDELMDAVTFLEKKWHLAADKATNAFGGGCQHHLRDFSHHGSPVGMFFSLLTQFTGKVYGTTTEGLFLRVDVSNSGLIGEGVPQKVFLGTIQWFFHMVSDVAGSSSSLSMGSAGTGIPGPILSLAKELSALPFFKHEGDSFSLKISKLFNGTFLAERDEAGKIINARPFDFRAELGTLQQLGKQSIPVIVNECIVRAFYFIRCLYRELREKKICCFSDFVKNVDWDKVLPWKNRTIVRMLTIATGTFAAVDITDAAIRSVRTKTPNNPVFWASFILKVNFVGVGRFAISVYSDVRMEFRRKSSKMDRQIAYNALLYNLNAKLYYKLAEQWQSAKNASMVVEKLKQISENSISQYVENLKNLSDDLRVVRKLVSGKTKGKESLKSDMLDILIWE